MRIGWSNPVGNQQQVKQRFSQPHAYSVRTNKTSVPFSYKEGCFTCTLDFTSRPMYFLFPFEKGRGTRKMVVLKGHQRERLPTLMFLYLSYELNQ